MKAGAAVVLTIFAASSMVSAATHVTSGLSGDGSKVVSSCRGAVAWQNARHYVGRYATVKGPVAGTKFAARSNGSPTFLDIGVEYPNPRRFTVVIWIENRRRFGAPERRYLGHVLCVRGIVQSYRGVPEIEATSPSQIAVLR